MFYEENEICNTSIFNENCYDVFTATFARSLVLLKMVVWSLVLMNNGAVRHEVLQHYMLSNLIGSACHVTFWFKFFAEKFCSPFVIFEVD